MKKWQQDIIESKLNQMARQAEYCKNNPSIYTDEIGMKVRTCSYAYEELLDFLGYVVTKDKDGNHKISKVNRGY